MRNFLTERLLAGDTLGSQVETARTIGMIEGLGFIDKLEEDIYGRNA